MQELITMSLNPNYNHTITHYHKDEEGWNKAVYKDCFFHSELHINQVGTQENVVNTYTVRIPAESLEYDFVAAKGDVVIHGECEDMIDDKVQGCRVAEVIAKHKPGAFRVTAVADNTGHLIDKHWRLGG